MIRSLTSLRQIVFLAVLIGIGTAAGGCAYNTAPPAGGGDPFPPPYNDPQIAVLTPELRQWLAFHPTVMIDDGERPMHVQVPVRNLTERQYLLEYRVLFYDAAGIEMEPKMGWRFVSLDPKQTARLDGRALSTDASNYKIEVRWSR